jgi:hypothetical protein
VAVPVKSAVVGRGLWRGVYGAGALVDGRAVAAAPAQSAAPPPVNGGQRHVRVLVLHLHEKCTVDKLLETALIKCSWLCLAPGVPDPLPVLFVGNRNTDVLAPKEIR